MLQDVHGTPAGAAPKFLPAMVALNVVPLDFIVTFVMTGNGAAKAGIASRHGSAKPNARNETYPCMLYAFLMRCETVPHCVRLGKGDSASSQASSNSHEKQFFFEKKNLKTLVI